MKQSWRGSGKNKKKNTQGVKIKGGNFGKDDYLEFNPDLINNDICTKDKAIIHFKNNGFKENRLYSNYHYLILLMTL